MNENDGTMALRLITDHMRECISERRETRTAIEKLSNLFVRFISGLIASVLVFGGYYFVQSQTLANQLATARATQTQAISQIPDETAAKVAAKLPAPSSGN